MVIKWCSWEHHFFVQLLLKGGVQGLGVSQGEALHCQTLDPPENSICILEHLCYTIHAKVSLAP